MTWPSNPIDQDVAPRYAAEDVLERWTFEGAAGLHDLSGPLAVSAPVPADFRATLLRARLGRVALEYFEASAHSVTRGSEQISAHPEPLLMVVFVLEGDLRIRTDDRSLTAGDGDTLLMDTRIGSTSTSSGNLRLLRSIVDPEHLPPGRRSAPDGLQGLLPRTPLVESYRAFVSAVLRAAPATPPRPGSNLAAALLQLHDAVLAEAEQVAELPGGPAALRIRITTLIDERHTDCRFDVAAIARALGVSVRQVHAVFNRGDRTVGRALKERRAATAAHLLDSAPGAVRLSDVARSSGFTDRAGLNRAFSERYGCTPAHYARQRHLP